MTLTAVTCTGPVSVAGTHTRARQTVIRITFRQRFAGKSISAASALTIHGRIRRQTLQGVCLLAFKALSTICCARPKAFLAKTRAWLTPLGRQTSKTILTAGCGAIDGWVWFIANIGLIDAMILLQTILRTNPDVVRAFATTGPTAGRIRHAGISLIASIVPTIAREIDALAFGDIVQRRCIIL